MDTLLEDMKLVIPLTGNGSRFVAAGYHRLKPFIKIHGKPLIHWVVKMFPGDEENIIFVCRQSHLNELDYMEKELKQAAPKATICALKNWEKKGPVKDVLKASDYFDDQKPLLISYCDYYMHWNYKKFKEDVFINGCDGAIPCYTNFHPHLIHKENLYASCKVDQDENLIEIKEKYSWTQDKTKSLHSPGVYYFKTAQLFKAASAKMIEAQDCLNGEYYFSLVYNYMVQKKYKVWCPLNVEHFCQWGTPKDLDEYLLWVNMIKNRKERL